MTRAYRVVGWLALLAALGCFGLIVLASVGAVESLEVSGVSLWPLVILSLFLASLVAAWVVARTKGRSGWLGVFLSLLDVLGLEILFRLKDRDAKERGHEG